MYTHLGASNKLFQQLINKICQNNTALRVKSTPQLKD